MTKNERSPKKSKKSKNKKDHNDIEKAIRDSLKESSPVRTKELIEDIKKLGYGESTIYKHISEMNDISIIKYKKLKEFGIEETDGRAVYIMLKKAAKLKEHYESILKLLESENSIERNLTIKEIYEYYKNRGLNQFELDKLIIILNLTHENLDKNIVEILDVESINVLLSIFHECFIDKKIKPDNVAALLDTLKSLLKKFPKKQENHPDLRRNIIRLLGFYNDEAVIEQIKIDATNLEDPSSVENDYYFDFDSNIIEEQITALFNFEMELRKDGKVKPAGFINRIKYYSQKPQSQKK
ncbi:hypothetical protein [Methanococcoides alaskense]|uniref:Uncharacterized protein n=1 Tax=Methanococcoides alaskense TaxID=325778 RepID=A0AA90ZB09_9EURY|nr:hypothetical protein [Methanococcoides alaskense]MDA0525462.1 hypothetical protein [Methanococcoides alaskense]MDR6221603.1 hypothetical protein [Methanococcoides alaskense]